MLGEPIGTPLAPAAQSVLVLESNIDDMSGQLLAALCEALFKAGALDVWSTAIAMKKGRPAQQISALVEPPALPAVERAFFLNSSTLGLRIFPATRRTLARSLQQVQTVFGPVGVKVGSLDGKPMGAMPEYEDCRRQASISGVPIQQVWVAAVAAAAPLLQESPALPRPAPRKLGKPARRRRP